MDHICIAPFFQGCGTGAGLIIAIGAQNAFVLKQGILKNNIFAVTLLCALIDGILISCGVGGFGAIITSNAVLLTTAQWGGAIFLTYYGFRSFRSSLTPKSLIVDASDQEEHLSLKATITTVLAISLLNPHVYLDTVMLLGSIGAQFPPVERIFFALGASIMSFLWFFGLGYGAGYLAPLFKKPLAWKMLDFFIGCIMWAIALSLLLFC